MLTLLPDISQTRFARKNAADELRAEETFSLLRQSILTRDAYTCQGCGLHLAATANAQACGLEVHHLNAQPRDNREDNLISLCALCHGIFHIGCFARRLQGGMRVIYCPELSQAHLNLLSWTLALTFFKTEASTKDLELRLKAKADRLNKRLLARATFPTSYFNDDKARATFHEKIRDENNISFLGTILGMLRNKYPASYTHRQQTLGGLRIFYDPRQRQNFLDRQGKNILERLAADPHWESGSHWSETWQILGQSLQHETPS